MMRSVCLAWDLGLGLVVGHHQDGLAALLVDLVQELHDLGTHLGIQVTGGLVRQDDGGVADQGAGDSHPLALTSGELRGEMPDTVVQSYGINHLQSPFLALGRTHFAVQQGHLHVVQDIERGNQVEALEDKSEFGVAEAGGLPGVEA